VDSEGAAASRGEVDVKVERKVGVDVEYGSEVVS